MNARPGPGDELRFADDLSRMLDQCDQNVERAVAETDGLFAVEKKPLGRGRTA